MPTYTIKTAVVPLLQFPRGASLELSIPVDAEYSMTGKRVEFSARTIANNGRVVFTANTDGAYISISSQTATISIPPTAASAANGNYSLADLQATGATEYRIDFLTGSGQPVDFRLQGNLTFLEQEGDWND